jgi:hypothetical protein
VLSGIRMPAIVVAIMLMSVYAASKENGHD